MKNIIIHNIPIEFERKRIKNMYLRILPPDGRVHISAPLKMSEEEIQRFVAAKAEWIRIQQEKVERRNIREPLTYSEGEEILIWGCSYRLTLRETTVHSRIEVIGDEVILYTKSDSSFKDREKVMNEWYKKALKTEIPFLLIRWEQRIGVKSNSYTIRNMKTRWGTCNIRTKNICLNLQLAKKQSKCLEYVVVHELVHLLEQSHNAVFKGYMDHFLPDWRRIKKELNGSQ